MADNQIPGAQMFDKLGIMKYAGDVRTHGTEKTIKQLIAAMKQLADNYHQRSIMMDKMKMVDGKGTERILNILENY